MPDLLIPGWALYLIAGLVIWMAWLTFKTFSNEQAIAINTTNDANVGREFKEIKEGIEKMSTETKQGFDKINNRLDIFMGNEITLLKGLIK